MGGHENRLTDRARQRQSNQSLYENAFNEGTSEQRPEEVAVVNELLIAVDRKELTNVFFDYLRKSGVPLENANIAVFENIKSRPLEDEEMYAAFNNFLNIIVFSTKQESFLEAKDCLSQGKPIPPEVSMTMQLQLVHEMCHAFSRNRIFTKDKNNSQVSVTSESGYGMMKSVIRQPARKFGTERHAGGFFQALNEGVTQRIAEEVFLELARRTGKGSVAEKFLASSITRTAEGLSQYAIYGNQVEGICEQIAAYTGVTQDDVWNAFKRGYFAKPELFAEETVGLFEETFGKEFLDEYSKLDNKTPLEGLARFDAKYGFPAPSAESAEKWLRHLGIERT